MVRAGHAQRRAKQTNKCSGQKCRFLDDGPMAVHQHCVQIDHTPKTLVGPAPPVPSGGGEAVRLAESLGERIQRKCLQKSFILERMDDIKAFPRNKIPPAVQKRVRTPGGAHRAPLLTWAPPAAPAPPPPPPHCRCTRTPSHLSKGRRAVQTHAAAHPPVLWESTVAVGEARRQLPREWGQLWPAGATWTGCSDAPWEAAARSTHGAHAGHTRGTPGPAAENTAQEHQKFRKSTLMPNLKGRRFNCPTKATERFTSSPGGTPKGSGVCWADERCSAQQVLTAEQANPQPPASKAQSGATDATAETSPASATPPPLTRRNSFSLEQFCAIFPKARAHFVGP